LFPTISANGLEPSVHTYNIMMTNLIKEGLLVEAEILTSMESAGCAPNSRLLNSVSAVGELRVFIRMFLLNLYENEVEALGPGPHQHDGAVVDKGLTPTMAKC
jgi:pentatricopeptide repeat protein